MCGFQAISVKTKILQKGDCEGINVILGGRGQGKADED